MDEIADLATRIVRFLEAAIAERRPERDIPASEQIREDMCKLLDATEASDETLARIAEAVVDAFAVRPELWPQAAEIAGIYLHDHEGEDAFDFLPHFVRSLVSRPSGEQRLAFFGSIEDWNTWRALGATLVRLALTAEEVATLLHSFDIFSRNDLARGEVLGGIRAFAGTHPDVAMKIVDGWMQGDPSFAKLDHDAIRHLVEAVVEAQGTREIAAWRDELIQALGKRPDEASWKLAMLLACFAWPRTPTTPTTTRHEALLRHVERLPERLAGTGLLAMIRDAKPFPLETIETTKRLLAIAEPYLETSETLREHPLIVARIADQAARGLTARQQALAPVGELFPWVLQVAPSQTRYGLGLDSFLAACVSSMPTETRLFVAQWLEKNAAPLRAELVSLEDIFPLLTHRLGPEGEAGWLVHFMTSPSATLRMVGSMLLGSRRRGLPLDNAFQTLTDAEANALAHQMVGSGMLGKIWVPALFRLAKAKPGSLATVREILQEEATLSYRSTCEASLKLWQGADGGDELSSARQDIERRLAELDQAHERKTRVAEILTTRPAAEAWRRVEQRVLSESVEQARAKSIFASLAVQIPIARGEQTVFEGEQEEPTPLKQVSFSMELPLLESIDPLGDGLSRYRHLQQAEAILSQQKRSAS